MRIFLSLIFFCIGGQLFANEHILEQEDFDAFQFSCVNEQSKKICDLRAFVVDPKNNEIISYLSVTINPEKMTQMQIAFPHAVNLKSPVIIQIDDRDPIELKYTFCNPSACFLAEIIAENFINALKDGNQLKLKALLLDNREATLTYSLGGFTAGYTKLMETPSL